MPTATKQIDIQKLSAIYDRIYDIADRLIKKHNPCNIHTKKVPAKDLFFNPVFPEKLITATFCNSKNNIGHLCCGGCKYWNKGCTVKALGCKLFLCQSVKNKILRKRFQKLRDYGIKHLGFDYYDNGIVWEQKFSYSIANRYFQSKEDWLKFMDTHEIL